MVAEESTFVFKHPLIQEVAYDSLLLVQRQMLHATAGRALETLYADRLEEIVDRLAYHYAKTTHATKAVEYLTRLAEKAARECAHAEAVTAWRAALEHLTRLPNESQDRQLPELGLRLVDSLHSLGRFTERLDVQEHQQARLARHQDTSRLGPWHVQLGFTYSMLGDHERAVQHAHHALTASTHSRDSVKRDRAHYVLALVLQL
jgi:predicted ATPase